MKSNKIAIYYWIFGKATQNNMCVLGQFFFEKVQASAKTNFVFVFGQIAQKGTSELT